MPFPPWADVQKEAYPESGDKNRKNDENFFIRRQEWNLFVEIVKVVREVIHENEGEKYLENELVIFDFGAVPDVSYEYEDKSGVGYGDQGDRGDIVEAGPQVRCQDEAE